MSSRIIVDLEKKRNKKRNLPSNIGHGQVEGAGLKANPKQMMEHQISQVPRPQSPPIAH